MTVVLAARSALVGVVIATVVGAASATAQPVIQPTSIVRVRANNSFGVAKDDLIPISSFAGGFGHAVTDTEIGTPARADNAATYAFTWSGAEAVFDVQTTQSHSVGSHGNLTEGYIQFVLPEPYVFEVSGQWSGSSADPGDAYQQRTFLRQFASPFATQYLEDETRIGTIAALYVNQGDDTGGGTFNQSGPAIGVLAAGTYEFSYELETDDRDVDQAANGVAAGRVRLVLRKPLPPTRLEATVTGATLLLTWQASRDASSYQLEAGTSAGASNLFVGDIGAAPQLQTTVPPGTYFARLRARRGGVLGAATPDVTFTVGTPACSAPPAAPAGHAAASGGTALDLAWGSSPGATSYVLEAGTASGTADLVVANLGSRLSFQVNAPARAYFTRVRALNACGASPPSNEAAFTVACVGPPAPAAFTSTRSAGRVTIAWQPSLGATAYVLAVGSATGASNVFAGSFGAATSLTFPSTVLPAGIYYFRVSAVGPCGQGPAATELVVTLP